MILYFPFSDIINYSHKYFKKSVSWSTVHKRWSILYMDRIQLIQDGVNWQAAMSTVSKLFFHKRPVISSLASGPLAPQSQVFQRVRITMMCLCSQIHELAQTRQLTSQITAKGAGLYDLLGKEVEMRVRVKYYLRGSISVSCFRDCQSCQAFCGFPQFVQQLPFMSRSVNNSLSHPTVQHFTN